MHRALANHWIMRGWHELYPRHRDTRETNAPANHCRIQGEIADRLRPPLYLPHGIASFRKEEKKRTSSNTSSSKLQVRRVAVALCASHISLRFSFTYAFSYLHYCGSQCCTYSFNTLHNNRSNKSLHMTTEIH